MSGGGTGGISSSYASSAAGSARSNLLKTTKLNLSARCFEPRSHLHHVISSSSDRHPEGAGSAVGGPASSGSVSGINGSGSQINSGYSATHSGVGGVSGGSMPDSNNNCSSSGGEDSSASKQPVMEISCEICRVTVNSSQQLKSHISGHKHKLRCYKKGLAAGSLTLTTDDESRTSQMAGSGGGGRGHHHHQRPDRHGRVGPGAAGPIASSGGGGSNGDGSASGSSNDAPSTGPSECCDPLSHTTTSSTCPSGNTSSSNTSNANGSSRNYCRSYHFSSNRGGSGGVNGVSKSNGISSGLLGPLPNQPLPLSAIAAWHITQENSDNPAANDAEQNGVGEEDESRSIGDGLLPLPKGLKPLINYRIPNPHQLFNRCSAMSQEPANPTNQGQGLQGGPAVQQRDRTKSGRKSSKSNHRASNTALQRRDSTTESDDNHAIEMSKGITKTGVRLERQKSVIAMGEEASSSNTSAMARSKAGAELRYYAAQPTIPSTGVAAASSLSTAHLNAVVKPMNTTSSSKQQASSNKSFACELCNVCLNSKAQLKQHLNSPRHNINYADSMAKAKADSAPGSALGGHHGSMHAGGSIGENLNSYSIPMLNMFLQTLQPPAQNCREAITCGTKSAKKISSSHRHRSGSAAAGGRGGSTESATGKKRPSFSSATGTAEPDEAMTAER